MNNFIEFVSAIPNGIFTIFASAIALLGGIYLFRMKNFSDASREFISAFSTEVAELKNPARIKAVRDILVEAFPRHSKAVVVFNKNLSWFRKRRFEKAWQQYHSGHQFDAAAWQIPTKERLFLDYFSFDTESKAATHALKQIHNLLRFAKQP
jgi:hypothetical protein